MPDIFGGGSSSSSVSADYNVKLDGRMDADLDNIQIKEIAPITVNSNLAVTRPIETQSTSKSDATANVSLKVEPLKAEIDTNSVIELKPVKADVGTNSVIDLKPVAVDSCQTIKLAPLPPICIDQPYSQHFGFTFMGMELWGFTISGKSEMNLHSPPKPQHYSAPLPGHNVSNKETREEQSSVRPRSGLRVRISD